MKPAVLLLLILTACTYTANVIEEPGTVEVYFCPEEQCQERILSLIETAADVRCAFYDLDLPELKKKLIEKDAVVVIEDSTAHEEFLTGYSSALMHNKFCVLDSSIVITGSMNPTERGNYYNNNNIVIIQSNAIAQNYLDEFSELLNNEYGTGEKVKNPVVEVGDVLVENYFCPEDNCKLHVLNALRSANKSVYFMAYSFTDEDLGNQLWNQAYMGLDVKGVLEEKQVSEYSRYEDLKEFSILDRNPYTMHHKVFIIDNRTVVSGSYNPTKNANERNDENVLIIHDEALAKRFAEEFSALWKERPAPAMTTGLIMVEIMYDAPGSDTGNEYVMLRNIGQQEVLLDYYFLSNMKSTSRLNGSIKPGETLKAVPKFSLRNANETLLLKRNHDVIDIVSWGKRPEGQPMIRLDVNTVSQDAWKD